MRALMEFTFRKPALRLLLIPGPLLKGLASQEDGAVDDDADGNDVCEDKDAVDVDVDVNDNDGGATAELLARPGSGPLRKVAVSASLSHVVTVTCVVCRRTALEPV